MSIIPVFIFPKKPWEILNKIGNKKKDTANLCYYLLDDQLENVFEKMTHLNSGITVSQKEMNSIQDKVLKSVSKKSEWYMTTLLSPEELWKDPEHKKTLQESISSAKMRNVSYFHRFIVVDDDINNIDTTSAPLKEIIELHQEVCYKLYLVNKETFITSYQSSNIEQEYLDFLLIKGRVVFGFKNDSNFKTITENETYQLFVKDKTKDIEKYDHFIEKLLYTGNHRKITNS